MQQVTSEWLHERGSLHDARVLDARWVGSNVEITLDDEWSNERELSLPLGASSGALVLIDASLSDGDISSAFGGWISEVTLVGRELHIAFCESAPLRFLIADVRWSGAEQQIG